MSVNPSSQSPIINRFQKAKNTIRAFFGHQKVSASQRDVLSLTPRNQNAESDQDMPMYQLPSFINPQASLILQRPREGSDVTTSSDEAEELLEQVTAELKQHSAKLIRKTEEIETKKKQKRLNVAEQEHLNALVQAVQIKNVVLYECLKNAKEAREKAKQRQDMNAQQSAQWEINFLQRKVHDRIAEQQELLNC